MGTINPSNSVQTPGSNGGMPDESLQRALATLNSQMATKVAFVTDPLTGVISIYGTTIIPDLTPSDPSFASTNVAKIQAALDGGGRVLIANQGVFYINARLIIGSNTSLELGKNTVIRRTATTFDNMLINRAYDTGTTTGVTVTWSSGLDASVAFTAHGKSEGGYITLTGGTPSTYLGTFRITTITDADNFVVRLQRVPAAAPSGSWVARTPDVNVSISGGTWDYNSPASQPQNGMGTMGFAFLYFQNFDVSNIRFLHVSKYCIYAGNYSKFHVSQMDAETDSDGAHCFGPAFGTVIDGVSGSYKDDAVAVSSRDVTGNFVDITYGDVVGFVGKNINVQSTTSCVHAYSYTGYLMDDITYDGVQGSAPVTVRLYGDTLNGGTMQKVTIRNLGATAYMSLAPYSGGTQPFTIQELHIEDCVLNTGSQTQTLIQTSGYTYLKNVYLKNCVSNNGFGTPSTGVMISFNGFVDALHILGGCYIFGVNGRLVSWTAAAVGIKLINIEGCRIEGGNSIVNKPSTCTDTPLINLRGNNISGFASVLAMSSNANITLSGNVFNNITTGVVSLYNAAATAVNVWETGNVYNSATRLSVTAGAYNPKSFDCQVDVGATGVTKTNGNMAFNTGAARGTLTQNRLVTCNGTNWVQVDVPLNVF